MLSKFKGKPELSADQLEGLSVHISGAITGGGSKGGDIKDQITALSDELGDDKMSELYGETLINPKKGLNSITKAGKKEGYKFDRAELGAALDEMNDAGAFDDVGLDDAAMTALMGQGGTQNSRGHDGGC